MNTLPFYFNPLLLLALLFSCTTETGKLADFVILEQDLMTEPEEFLRNLLIKGTYEGGEKVY